MQTIIDYLSQIQNLIAVLAAIILAAIAYYWQIKAALGKAKTELANIAMPMIGKAEDSPAELLRTIVDKPANLNQSITAVTPLFINSNEGKNLIVSSAAFEKAKTEKPKLLKKLGISSISDMIPFISNVYQFAAKPIIKAMKK